jgi:hypothetical protein
MSNSDHYLLKSVAGEHMRRPTWLRAEKSRSFQQAVPAAPRLWNWSSFSRAPSTTSKFATCTIPPSRWLPVPTAIVIDGRLADCHAERDIDEATLTQAIFG